ncbi:WD40/YVTN/BNR-like repeat-containing protein [Flavobacterium capsici]|uniref:Exo-alpha-sialidase n=1 Tax=Flavobacterium capsici TaxID=3075618 RepID=A0AA96F492_9FLAO|nr:MULTISPECIES: hypothetical protein [unclassified Flavobacterium]WNM18339.1 hypothetical protein RN608_09965 [Flavobacterium sp. PMR2A8]WNM22390.1 hypothetical protein RN605_03265 [Flavobacterium sp. PMTSA4]
MKKTFLLLLLLFLYSCNSYNSKWEEIKGSGIVEKGTLNKAIYFQDSLTGLIGGYTFRHNKESQNIDKMDKAPLLYLTKNGGKNWKLLKIDYEDSGIDNIKIENDTIICQIDSLLLKSTDLGNNWNVVEKSNYKEISEKYFSDSNPYKISNYNFKFENKNYRIKEKYQHKNTTVIVCNGEKSMTDYFFISRDNGNNWKFLQNEFGSNKMKFLLNEDYLLAYDSQYGLQKLKLN